MARIKQTLTWTPKAKDRPRFAVRNGKVSTYTAAATRDAEKALAAQWANTAVEGPIKVRVVMSDTDVKIDIDTVDAPTSKKLRADCDNYLKLVLDALNGVAWLDDSQIVELTGVKR